MVEAKESILDQEISPLVQADHLVRREVLPHRPFPPTDRNDPLPPPLYETILDTASIETVPTIQNDDDDDNNARITAAGIGSGVVGLLFGGPIVALIFGFGGAYAAEKKDGLLGDTARSVGDVALSVQEKAKNLDRKYNVMENVKDSSQRTWERAKQFDHEHKVLDKTKDLVVYSWFAMIDFVRRHHLIERGVNGVGKGFCWLIEKIEQKVSKSTGNGNVNPARSHNHAATESRVMTPSQHERSIN